MSGDPKDNRHDRSTGGFVARWSRLKRAAAPPVTDPLAAPTDPAIQSTAVQPAEPQKPPLTDADMPPLETLDEHSDYSGFLSEQVSEALRRQALRKLFHSAAFNLCDGLDDYAGDFTSFEKLGDIVTSDMRHQLALAEEKLKSVLAADQETSPETAVERAAETASEDGEPPSPEPVTAAAGLEASGDSDPRGQS